jgi:hypothetical protein
MMKVRNLGKKSLEKSSRNLKNLGSRSPLSKNKSLSEDADQLGGLPMPGQRKLGRATDVRLSILRGLVTALVVNGKIETTEARAREVKRIAEK